MRLKLKKEYTIQQGNKSFVRNIKRLRKVINMRKIKNISSTIFILIMTIGLIIFIINWGFVDWDEVSKEYTDTALELLDSVHCEIDYKDFHYKGLCVDRNEIFQIVKDLESYGNYSRDKDREHYCKVGAYWLWIQEHPTADIVAGENYQIDYKDIEKWCEGADWK